jgi:hypothetical protein
MSGDSYAAEILDPKLQNRGNTKTNESARFAILTQLKDITLRLMIKLFSIFDWEETDGKFGTEQPIPLVTYGEMLIITEVDARGSVLTGTTSYNKYRALLNMDIL